MKVVAGMNDSNAFGTFSELNQNICRYFGVVVYKSYYNRGLVNFKERIEILFRESISKLNSIQTFHIWLI